MVPVDTQTYERLYRYYYHQYFTDLYRLLSGQIKSAWYFNYQGKEETLITRQELADLIDDEKADLRAQIMGAALDQDKNPEGRIVIMDALDKIAHDGTERMAKYYFDNYLDLEPVEP